MVAISRRAALTGAATLAVAALPLPALADAGADAGLLAMERQITELHGRWEDAIDVFGEAESAFWKLKRERRDSAETEAAEARKVAAEAATNALDDEVDAMALELCSTPAATIAGLACKARVALFLGSDDLPEMILEELVRFGGQAHG